MNKTLNQNFRQILQQQKSLSSISQQNLPMISLNQLESKVNLFKKKHKQKQNLSHQLANHNDINVCSPFYDRMKTHKQNCKCPYHKKQRLTLVSVRQTDKSPPYRGHQIQRNTTKQKADIPGHHHQNNSYIFKKSLSQMNKSTLQEPSPYSLTQPINHHQKAAFHGYSYEQFMKDCNYFMLNKNGFALGKSNHVVRKGVKEIFQFINKHLDYSVQKMTQWIDSIQKDKDYGEFYVERFKVMKINFQMNKKNRTKKTADSSNFPHLFNKTQKFSSKTPKFSRSTLNLSKLEPDRQKNPAKKNLSSDQFFQQQFSASSEQGSSDCDSNDFEVSLDTIVSQLKLKQNISDKTSQRIMKKRLSSFKQLFQDLQKNIMNQKYSNDLLQKFDCDFLQSLLKNYSNNKSIKQIQAKIEIIAKTYETLKEYRTRKSTETLKKTNPNEASCNEKGFGGSKRNTQVGQNNKTTNSSDNHSKSYTEKLSFKDIKDSNDKFNTIEEADNELDEDGINGHKNGKNLNHGNIRRSRLIKEDQIKLNQIRSSHVLNPNSSERNIQKQRQNVQKCNFTRAQKFLFDINMGKTIINNQDSIFTMKRKVRVMKILLKDNHQSPQANQLKEYIQAIDHKIYAKTNVNKQKATNISSAELISDDEIWRLLSLENLGFNLIFYNLTSKINAQENDDLCILLNEIKINKMKKFENNVSYKNDFKAEQNLQTNKRNLKKNKAEEDIFVQEEMGNMKFEPKIQSESLKDLKNTQITFKMTKTRAQNFKDLNKLLINTEINEPFELNLNKNKFDNIQMQKKIKKILKYTKIHLPQTFQKYLKNTAIQNVSQTISFIDS